MRMYKVSFYRDGAITTEQTFNSRKSAVSYAQSGDDGVYYIVETMDITNAHVRISNADVFYNGYRLGGMKDEATVEKIQNLEGKLPRVLHTDGTCSLLPLAHITVRQVQEIVGGWYNIAVVEDGPPRWVVLYKDNNPAARALYCIPNIERVQKIPRVNKLATKKFNREFRGDVLYTLETLIE